MAISQLGSVAVPGTLLDVKIASTGGPFTTTSNAYAAIATALQSTITVPSTGNLIVRACMPVELQNQAQYYMFTCLDGSNVQMGTEAVATHVVGVFGLTLEFYITGKTPGASLTIKLAHKLLTVGSATGVVYSAAGSIGTPVMTVLVAP